MAVFLKDGKANVVGAGIINNLLEERTKCIKT